MPKLDTTTERIFISLAKSLVPELSQLINGDRDGILEPVIIRTVADLTNTYSATEASLLITSDADLAMELVGRLKTLSAVAKNIQARDALLPNESYELSPNAVVRTQKISAFEPSHAIQMHGLGLEPAKNKADFSQMGIQPAEMRPRPETIKQLCQRPSVLTGVILSFAAVSIAMIMTIGEIVHSTSSLKIASANEKEAVAILASAKLYAMSARGSMTQGPQSSGSDSEIRNIIQLSEDDLFQPTSPQQTLLSTFMVPTIIQKDDLKKQNPSRGQSYDHTKVRNGFSNQSQTAMVSTPSDESDPDMNVVQANLQNGSAPTITSQYSTTSHHSQNCQATYSSAACDIVR